MTTLDDVAREAGVSKSTVSRVLNNHKHIAPATRSKVEAVIKRLNYHCLTPARMLRTGRTRMIGVVVPDLQNDYFVRIIEGSERAAARRGYNVMICNCHRATERERDLVRLFLQRKVDGLVFGLPLMTDAELIELAWKVPVSILGRRVLGELSAPVTVVDNETAAYNAVSHLIREHGKLRIAYIQGMPGPHKDDLHRYTGYCQALTDNGLQFNPGLIGYAQTDGRQALEAMKKIIADGHQPDAVFCYNDLIAMRVYRAAMEMGLEIPRDLAVIGVDNTALSKHVTPGLTTIDIPCFEMGDIATTQLIDRLEDKTETVTIFNVVPAALVTRGSCGCPEP